jgi:hypothetical protein
VYIYIVKESKMSVKKFNHIKKVFDPNTGETIVVEKQFTVGTKDTEHFYCTYINSIGRLYGLKSLSDFKVIIEFCVRAEFNTGIIDISIKKRKELCDKLEISSQSLSNSIARLKELRLLAGEKGTYQINPEIFWKGDANERLRLLKTNDFKITFSIIPKKDMVDVTEEEHDV